MYPKWLIKRTPKSENIRKIRTLLGDSSVNTVCESAKCPNIGECFSQKTVTFMIMGNICTRNCKFCAIAKGSPEKLDKDEPQKIARAAEKLGLDYVVATSVTRDDISDGGAAHFSKTIQALKFSKFKPKIEVLIPDFGGSPDSLNKVLQARPDVLNHNVETVPRLYCRIRPLANYDKSINLLKRAKKSNNSLYTKSGIMVGLGERIEEVVDLMRDLRRVDCDVLTIGQYLRPSKDQVSVSEFISPEVFEHYERTGKALGFKKVFSGPFVRSSYKASEIYV